MPRFAALSRPGSSGETATIKQTRRRTSPVNHPQNTYQHKTSSPKPPVRHTSQIDNVVPNGQCVSRDPAQLWGRRKVLRKVLAIWTYTVPPRHVTHRRPQDGSLFVKLVLLLVCEYMTYLFYTNNGFEGNALGWCAHLSYGTRFPHDYALWAEWNALGRGLVGV